MNQKRKDIVNCILLFIISLLLVFDLFINIGQPATFDGPTHLTNIGMFFKSLKEGDLRVTWTDGFANYGMPIGLMAQQTTSYLGGFINFITNNIVLSYNIVLFIGAFLSTFFLYIFLRLYFKPESAFIGAFLFNFAPYRILNIYIRGAIPEFFSSVFVPLILIGIYLLINKKNLSGFFIILLSTAFLILTHPFIFVVGSFIFIPYIFFNWFNLKNIKTLLIAVLAFILGISLTSYYLLPLFLEIKYFYYGSSQNHLISNQYMSLANYFDPRWFYFYKGDIFTRGHVIQAGLIEMMVLLTGILFLVFKTILKINKKFDLLSFSVIISLIAIFFTTSFSDLIYKNINILSGIQYPWRMFSTFIFLPPIILAYLINKTNNKLILYGIIFLICLIRFPQVYGKNYTLYPQSYYSFTIENLHGNRLNTIWTGPARDYPVKKQKGKIIEGQGKIISSSIKNIQREYTVKSNGRIRMADYTFYFPGWKVYVDGTETEIQFQDPNYRGVITYYVPSGKHNISVKFEDTKKRQLGSLFTTFSIIIFLLLLISYLKYRKNLTAFIYEK